MRVAAAVLGLIAIQALIGAKPARAGGIEYAGAGTQALARGGAVAARADDPMVLMYNPAGLVELRGAQLMLNANLALMDACVDPFGYYGWSAYGGGKPSRLTDPDNPADTVTLNLGRPADIGPAEQAYYTGALDTVCMNQNLTPVPEVGFTARVTDRFAFGIGLMFPGVTPQGHWGGETGLIRGAAGLRPAATRYMMINSGTIGLFPTIGLAYKIADWLRIGASFRSGVINVDNTSIAAVQVGTTPANDQLVRVNATDWFIPELTGSLHIVPVDAIDVVVGFHYQGDLDAPGDISITTGLYDSTLRPRTKVNGIIGVRQKFPWKGWVGVRYADRLAPRPRGKIAEDSEIGAGGSVQDAFQTERWDVEADIHYEMNARHRELSIEYVPDQFAEFESLSGMVTTQAFPDPSMPSTRIQKRWKDQISVRVGGSYNILPGLFGVSAGFHFENRGVDPSYMQIDYWPLQRVGLHGGIRVRIAKTVDLTFAYAHIFQETLVVAAPAHQNVDVIGAEYLASGRVVNIDKRAGLPSSETPLTPLEERKSASVDGEARLTQNFAKALRGTPPAIVNSGRYRSGMNVISAGMNLHF
jgi:long-subunit fatty acid transport protein